MSKLNVTGIVVVCTLLSGPITRADVVVYKKSCGHYAYEDWNLTCKINKNTFEDVRGAEFWAGPFRGLQSITICASFHNHGIECPSNYHPQPQRRRPRHSTDA